jgi:hypothetical protein
MNSKFIPQAFFALAALLATTLFASPAAAQHFDIGLALDPGTNQIVPGSFNLSGTPGDAGNPVLVITGEPLGETEVFRLNSPDVYEGGGELGFGTVNQTDLDLDNPPAGTFDALPGSTDIFANFVPVTAGATGNLLKWNGAGFSNVSPTTTFSVVGDDSVTAGVDGADNGFVSGFLIQETSPDGSIHKDLLTFLDDSGDLDGPGVYLAGLQFDAAGLNSSEPFYLLIGAIDGATTTDVFIEAELEAADEWLEENVFEATGGGFAGVPEPSTCLLLAALLPLLRRRRRK